MLVLGRKVGESIIVEGGVVIRVLATRGRNIRLGIEAPREVTVWREEKLPPTKDDKVTR